MTKKSGAAANRPDARQSPRRELALSAQIVGAVGTVTGIVLNISASGVLLQAAGMTWSVGTTVEFVLNAHGRALRIPATVVRVEPESVALRFGRYDSVVYTDLIEAIYQSGYAR